MADPSSPVACFRGGSLIKRQHENVDRRLLRICLSVNGGRLCISARKNNDHYVDHSAHGAHDAGQEPRH